MRRFRKFLRPVPLLALVAAVQLAFALGQSHALVHAQEHASGHIHRAAAAGRSAGRSVPVALVCRAIVQHKGCDDTPARDHTHDCALCWVTAAASGGMLPPVLPVTFIADRSSPPTAQRVAPAIYARNSTAFDARGPPATV